MRRLIGKVAMSLPQTQQDVNALKQTQVAIGTRMGAEQTTMIVQEAVLALKDNGMVDDWAVPKVDLSNAFNAVSRQVIL